MTVPRPQQRKRNRVTGLAVAAVAVGMVGMAFAAVPLYKLFCQVTGYGGTPQTVNVAAAPGSGDEASQQVVIRVRFDGNVSAGLPWHFRPVQREMTVRPGEQTLAFYRAENTGSEPIVGTATFNVTPLKIGQYFAKIDCFCFTNQRLEPGQSMDMPVQFYVDPAMLEDDNAKEVRTITLSYTFFRAEDQGDGDAAPGGGTADVRSRQETQAEYSGPERAAAGGRG